jgi:transcriptional regulator with XRE-family HTH domain
MAEVSNVRPLRRPAPSRQPEPLWREVLGSRLRELRRQREEKLTETAGRAGISPQYLSEVERGRKEPSSEMIAALAGAFDLTLIDLATLVAEDLRRHQAATARPGPRPVLGNIALRGTSPGNTAARPASRPAGPVAMAIAA